MSRAGTRAVVASALGVLAAAAAVSSVRVASAAEPQQPTFPPPDEDTGVERPMPPDDRTGHLYLIPSFGVVGGVGAFGPNTPTSSLLGLGYVVGASVGIGIGRYGTIQIIGDRMAFGAPSDCNIGGCTGTSYSIGVGFSYHLTQVLAFDPWASFGMAYRTTSLALSQNASATVDGVSCPSGKLCPETYRGLDAARISIGGDFYPTPWFGFGPFLEIDIGTNLQRPVSNPPIGLPPNVYDGPRTFGLLQAGIRVAFDPMRAGYRRPPPTGAPEGALPPAAPAAPATDVKVSRSGQGPGFLSSVRPGPLRLADGAPPRF